MKQQVPVPVVIGLILLSLAGLVFFIYKAMQPPDVTDALKAKAEYNQKESAGKQNRYNVIQNKIQQSNQQPNQQPYGQNYSQSYSGR
jgi:hypothetical protein